jgi:hypothetical protein
MAGAILIPPFCLHHILALLNAIDKKRKILFLSYLTGFIFFISDFTPLFIKGVVSKSSFEYWPTPGPLFHFYVVIFFATVVYFMFFISGISNLQGN